MPGRSENYTVRTHMDSQSRKRLEIERLHAQFQRGSISAEELGIQLHKLWVRYHQSPRGFDGLFCSSPHVHLTTEWVLKHRPLIQEWATAMTTAPFLYAHFNFYSTAPGDPNQAEVLRYLCDTIYPEMDSKHKMFISWSPGFLPLLPRVLVVLHRLNHQERLETLKEFVDYNSGPVYLTEPRPGSNECLETRDIRCSQDLLDYISLATETFTHLTRAGREFRTRARFAGDVLNRAGASEG